MITAIVQAAGSGVRPGTEALAATLSSLVPGVADGLVADAVVVAEAGDAGAARLAEAAGAAHLALTAGGDPWRLAAPLARRDWLLCLDAGDVPREGWITVLDRFLAGRPSMRLARLGRARPTAGERLIGWRDRVLGADAPRAGDLVHRALLARDWPRNLRPVRLGAGLERIEP